jgi:hypothetical protein
MALLFLHRTSDVYKCVMLKLQADESNLVSINTYCSMPHTKLILNSWGEVSMCCHQLTQLGKLTEQNSVLEIWNSALAKEIRKSTEEGRLHAVCASWNSCPFVVKDRQAFPQSIYRNSLYPTYLEICLPDKHCNVGGETPDEKNPACIMCRRNFHIPDQPDLTDFLCEKAKVLIPHLRNLCVLGIAEPFWKDATFKILAKLDFWRYKNRIRFTTNTNGICLNQKVQAKFFSEVELSDISWSMDAATPDTYRQIRRQDTFNLVVRNLNNWLQERKKHGGSSQHRVIIYNNINMINLHEMSKMVVLAKEWGVDGMIMLPTYDQSGVVQLGDLMLCDKNVDLFARAADKAMQISKEIGLDLFYSKRFDLAPPAVSDIEAKNLVQLHLPKRI